MESKKLYFLITFFRFFVAKFPEFFERLQKLGPKAPNFEDLQISESENRPKSKVKSSESKLKNRPKAKVKSSESENPPKVKSLEEKLEEARYNSVKHLVRVIAEILEEFKGFKSFFISLKKL